MLSVEVEFLAKSYPLYVFAETSEGYIGVLFQGSRKAVPHCQLFHKYLSALLSRLEAS